MKYVRSVPHHSYVLQGHVTVTPGDTQTKLATYSRSTVHALAVGDRPLEKVIELLLSSEVLWSHKVHHAPVLCEVVLEGVAGHDYPSPVEGEEEGREGEEIQEWRRGRGNMVIKGERKEKRKDYHPSNGPTISPTLF